MRQHFETPETLKAERTFADKVERRFSVHLEKLAIKYSVDFMAIRDGKLAAWIELKNRNNASNRYETYMLSLDKWLKGQSLYHETGAPFVLCIRFTDCDMFVLTDKAEGVYFAYKGRTIQARDSQDVEPVAMIPMTAFMSF